MMDETIGFTIICNKCKREVKYKDKKWYSDQFDKDYEIKFGIAWPYEEGEIKCKCGNVIEF